MDKQYRHLSSEERAVVMVEHGKGMSLRGIARELGRNVSTIAREVHRNRPSEGPSARQKVLAYDATTVAMAIGCAVNGVLERASLRKARRCISTSRTG